MRPVALAACVLLTAALSSHSARACSVHGPDGQPTVESVAAAADSIVLVRVSSLEPHGPQDLENPAARANFEVIEVLKGKPPLARAALAGMSSCDVQLWPGYDFVLLFDDPGSAPHDVIKPSFLSFLVTPGDEVGDLASLRKFLTAANTP